MIRPVRGWLDSAGELHARREDACKAEFRRLLADKFGLWPIGDCGQQAVLVDELVDGLFDLDKMIGQATKEDSRADLAG